MSWSPGFGIQSTGNTTTAILGSGGTFIGVAEQNAAPDVMCSCYANTAGTLYFDFSVNGTDWRSFPPTGFTVSAGIHEFHVARKGPRYFRVRYVNGASAQSTFQLFIYYGSYGQPMAPIGFTIADDADAVVTKSVISGVGNTTAKVTDHQALQVTPPPEAKSSFGDALVAELDPVVQLTFCYNLNPLLFSTLDNGGTSAIDTSMLKLSTGAGANQSSTMLSVGAGRYEAGLGLRARFTALFTTGVANSTQIIGFGDSGEGYFFGYNGTSFGILRRYGGFPEIRTLTISTASSDNENITITLDGDADATVAVTNSGVATTTANEIAAHDYSTLGRGWTATAVGNTVVFKSWSSEPRTGTYGIAATSAAGTYARTLEGVSPTDTWTAQTSWNGDDIFDGTGLTGITLDTTKGNVYQIDFQYLGFGAVRFYLEDPDDGELHLVHTIEYANANTRPHLDNPTLPLYASVENTSNTSDVVMKSGSMAIFVDGSRRVVGVNRGVKQAATVAAAGNTPVLTIRVAETYASKLNRSQIKLQYVACSCEHTKPVRFNFYANATLTGASFSSIDSNTSAVQTDTTATAVSGGLFLFAIPLSKSGNATIDLKDDLDLARLNPGDSITVAAEYGSGTNADVVVAFNFTEMI